MFSLRYYTGVPYDGQTYPVITNSNGTVSPVTFTISVGDDPTLIPLFEKVGLSIAFNPVNESVAKKTDVVIKSGDCVISYLTSSLSTVRR